MEKIGWIVERVNNCQVFIRQFPIFGSLIKIQRPALPIPFKKIEKIAKKYRAFRIVIEPGLKLKRKFREFGYKKSNSPYLPPKTIHIDLTFSEKKIFKNFKESKRRGIKKAVKNGVLVKQSRDIESFIKLKSRQFFPLGFLIKKEIKALWQTFYPKNVCLLLAYKNKKISPLAGILLLFHQKTSYYWLAVSTKIGKKLFAPSLLVWEAIKLSKKRGCRIFDFEGIYDPRFPQATKSWRGFTRFKKGFGGKEVEYPGCFVKYRFF